MRRILGCAVPETTLQAWSRHLVFDLEPVFLTDDLRDRFGPGVFTLNRDEFQAMSVAWPLEFRDAYQTYQISEEGAPWVTLLQANAVRALEPTLRSEVMVLQQRLGRGQVYRVADLEPEMVSSADVFEVAGEPWLALRADVWQGLPDSLRHTFLERLVSQDEPDCLSGTLDQATRALLNATTLEVMGRFAPRSGPNCFATVLAAVLNQPHIADLWLHTAPFLRALEEAGFHAVGMLNGTPEPGMVLVWGDQHACLVLGQGLALNKDSQAWWAPRRVLKLELVLERWADAAVPVQVYSRV